VFEDRVLRRVLEPEEEDVAGGWRRLHKEELHNLDASPNVIRVIKSMWMGTCSTHGGDKKYIQNFGWKTWREDIMWKN
jgi:hypothetical protein